MIASAATLLPLSPALCRGGSLSVRKDIPRSLFPPESYWPTALPTARPMLHDATIPCPRTFRRSHTLKPARHGDTCSGSSCSSAKPSPIWRGSTRWKTFSRANPACMNGCWFRSGAKVNCLQAGHMFRPILTGLKVIAGPEHFRLFTPFYSAWTCITCQPPFCDSQP